MEIKRDKREDLKKLAKVFLSNLEINDCEYGGIGVDSKRPFGNSDVDSDILEIIGWEMEGNDGNDSCYSSKQREYSWNLYHKELIPFLNKEFKFILNNNIKGAKKI